MGLSTNTECSSHIKLSVVATLYHSSQYIEEFCRRVNKVVKTLGLDSYEIILVNDGSPDESFAIAIALAEEDPHVVVVNLSRNFGHHRAMMTGLRYARGEKVFLIDIDLEEEPEWLLPFDAFMTDTGCDVVYGVQKSRKGNQFEKVSGEIFWYVFNKVSSLNMTPNTITCRLMTRKYLDAVLAYQEREVCAHAVWHDVGFDQRPYIVTKASSSPTTYSLARKVALFVNAVTSFSNKPLSWIFYFGFLVSFGAFVSILYLVGQKILFATPISGWTSLITSIWLFGGLISMFLGVIGIYVGKIFAEVKQRPYSVVEGIYSKEVVTNRGSKLS